jgi:hypothetical protein
MNLRLGFLRDARTVGAVMCITGLTLLLWPSLLAAALGVELLAGAFWWWARAAGIPRTDWRWSWLRRAGSCNRGRDQR